MAGRAPVRVRAALAAALADHLTDLLPADTMKPLSRRTILATGAGLIGGAHLSRNAHAALQDAHAHGGALPPGRPDADYTPVITPNGATLPWKEVDGVKVFHLVAEPVTHEFAPG